MFFVNYVSELVSSSIGDLQVGITATIPYVGFNYYLSVVAGVLGFYWILITYSTLTYHARIKKIQLFYKYRFKPAKTCT